MASAWVGGSKTPPYSVHSEKSLLGALLVDPGLIGTARQVVHDGTVFFRSQHGQLYDAMLRLVRTQRSLDPDRFVAALEELLGEEELLEKIGGRGYLNQLVREAAPAQAALEHARQIQDKALLRQLIEVASDILSDAYGSGDRFEPVLSRARERMKKLGEASRTSKRRQRDEQG